MRQYVAIAEQQLSELLESRSIAYYLHPYRLSAPGAIGENQDTTTITLVRATWKQLYRNTAYRQFAIGSQI